MSDFESDIFDLREKTEQNRREFLRTEVQTCFIALDRATLVLSLGETHEAKQELAIVRHGIQVVERFLGEKADAAIAAKLAELKKAAESLQLELDAYP